MLQICHFTFRRFIYVALSLHDSFSSAFLQFKMHSLLDMRNEIKQQLEIEENA